MAFDNQEDEIPFLAKGGVQALATLFSKHQHRLQRLVKFRLDRRLWGRVDVSDVLQDAFMAASRRLPSYLNQPSVPFYVWFRQITLQVLTDIHRFHLGAKMRSAGVEVSIRLEPLTQASSLSLAAHLVDSLTSPSGAVEREESLQELRRALDSMDSMDREVLALRHFEELGNNEVAQILGIQVTAASMRYVRALKRLREILSVIGTDNALADRKKRRPATPPILPDSPEQPSLSDSSASGCGSG
ncbi:MAG: sigma-70 family RNA polymerase sigma factor [Pirellulaceae bacterium]|nr:sigma-70 family RNA polymerase sigma factor [Pirellulaceae bacterium]